MAGFVNNAEYLEASALARLQQENWQVQQHYVSQNSPFFQNLWGNTKPPEDLRDLPNLPFSDKAMLRLSQAASAPFGDYLTADSKNVARLHRTSGTTGQAMNLALSAEDAQITQRVGGRCQRAAGLGPGHRAVHCLNYRMWMGGLTDHMTLEETGAMVVPFGVGETRLLIRTIQEIGITAISCTPSYPAVLEQVIVDDFPHLKPRDLGLKLGLFGGEAGLDSLDYRNRITEVWGMSPRNANYGVSDVFCNFASQCPDNNDLHFLASDVLYPELIDPDTLQPLPIEEGITGELVLTHLHRQAQPLVRFRCGDILTITQTGPCPHCARTGFRFRVVGRSDDMVVVRGINVFPTMAHASISAIPELGGEYVIRLKDNGPFDTLPLEAELAQHISVDEAERSSLNQQITRRLKQELGVTVSLTLQPYGSLPRTEGKTRRVIREDG